MGLRKRADTVLVVTTSGLSEKLNHVTNGKVWMQNSKDNVNEYSNVGSWKKTFSDRQNKMISGNCVPKRRSGIR